MDYTEAVKPTTHHTKDKTLLQRQKHPVFAGGQKKPDIIWRKILSVSRQIMSWHLGWPWIIME